MIRLFIIFNYTVDKKNDCNIGELHSFIANMPEKEHFMIDDNAKDFEKIFNWIVNYATACYGMKDIRQKLMENQGKILLDFITTSDMAYVEAVIEDSKDQWDHIIELEDKIINDDEKKKFLKKNQRDMSKQEQSKYTMTPKKFTIKQRRKNTFGRDGWSSEGKKYYKVAWAKWKQMYRDRELYDRMLVVYAEWVSTNEVLKEWRKSYRTNYDDNNDSDVDEDEADDIRFVIPGNEDYIPDRPWAIGTMEGGSDNNESPRDVQIHNTLQRNTEGGYNMRKRKSCDNNSDDDTRSSDDDDM